MALVTKLPSDNPKTVGMDLRILKTVEARIVTNDQAYVKVVNKMHGWERQCDGQQEI